MGRIVWCLWVVWVGVGCTQHAPQGGSASSTLQPPPVGVLPPGVSVQLPTAVPSAPVERSEWRGEWTSPAGYLYAGTLALEVGQNGSVSGAFRWQLRVSPLASEQGRLGLEGVEYVGGAFDAVSAQLLLQGTHKDDPHAVIGLDTYELSVSQAGDVLKGRTHNHGDWKGQIKLTHSSGSLLR